MLQYFQRLLIKILFPLLSAVVALFRHDVSLYLLSVVVVWAGSNVGGKLTSLYPPSVPYTSYALHLR